MLMRFSSIALLAFAVAACNTMGQLTVKNYKAKSGQTVMAGQAEPKAEYNCHKVTQEKAEWGLGGTMDRVAAQERVTAAAVEAAPGKGANYAQIMPPAQIGVGSVNVNAFSSAQVAYYKCASLAKQ